LIISFTDAAGKKLADNEIVNSTGDRVVWTNVEVYLGDDFYPAAPIDVKNFTLTDLDCEEDKID